MSDEIGKIESTGNKQPSRLLMLAVLFISIAAIVTPLIIAKTLYVDEGISKNAVLTELVLPVASLLFMLLTIILVSLTDRAGILNLIWFRPRGSEIAGTILLILIVILAHCMISVLLHILGLSSQWSYAFWAEGRGLAFFITITVFIAVIGPILEEIFWRGYVQATLERMFGGLPALLGQAVLFGMYHIRPLGGFIQMLFLAFIAGMWRWRRRTILPVILAHIVLNSLWCAAQWPDWLDCTRIRRSVNYVAQYEAIAGIAELDPNDNARNLYELARQLAVAVPPEFEQVKNLWPKNWSAEQHAAMSDWLSDNEKMLDYVEQGTRKSYYWPELIGQTMSTAMPELAWIRNSVFAICTRAQLSAADGDLDDAFSDLVTCLRLADHLAVRRPNISQFVAFSIRGVAVGSAFRILENTDVPSETLEHFQIRLEQSLAEDTHTLDFEVERLFLLDSIQSMFTDNGAGNGYIPEIALRIPRAFQNLLPEFSEQQKQALLKLDKRATTILADKFFDLLDDAAKMTSWQFRNNTGSIRRDLESIIRRNAFISEFGSILMKSLEIASRARTDLEALRATLAILRYEAQRGQLPSSLHALVDQGFLKSLPQDSFSDGPLVYKQTSDGFLLYSFGLDFDDDGGTPSKWGDGEEGGDQVFWPVKGANEDVESAAEVQTP